MGSSEQRTRRRGRLVQWQDRKKQTSESLLRDDQRGTTREEQSRTGETRLGSGNAASRREYGPLRQGGMRRYRSAFALSAASIEITGCGETPKLTQLDQSHATGAGRPSAFVHFNTYGFWYIAVVRPSSILKPRGNFCRAFSLRPELSGALALHTFVTPARRRSCCKPHQNRN